MKNLLNLRWLHCSPNQTGETLTRENRLGIGTCLNPMRTLLITLLLLTLGVGQMWAKNVYLVAGTWHQGSEEHWVHSWGSEDSDVKMDLLDNESEIYVAVIPDGNNNYIFTRNTTGSTGPWDKKDKQTSNFENNSYNCCHITGWDSWEMNTNLTTATVYFASSASNVWVNVNREVNSKDLWSLVSMTSTGKTYNGVPLYSATFNLVWGGVGVLQFKEDDEWGSKIINSSTITSSSTFDDKLYNGSSWVAYNYDVTVSFNMGGHGSAVSSQTILKGTTASEPSTPVDGDWTFEGWYEESTFVHKWNFSSTINSDKVLYAHWTQEPTVTNLSASAGDIYSGEGSITLTATRNTAASSLNIQYQVKVPGGSWTNIGDAVNSTTKTYSPTNGDGTYEFRAYPAGYSSNNASTDKRVYEHWNIYVRDDVDNWGTMKLYLYDNSTSTSKSAWPGDACSSYKSSAKWYTVTLDSKWPHFILNNNNNGKQLLGNGSIATDKATYAPGSYWKTVWNSDGTGGDSGKKFYILTSATITDPVVTITRCDVYSTYALLEGNVTGFGGDGSALSDLKEYGFYVGETKHTTILSTSGTRFRVKVKSLTPGNTYNIKAFATNIDNTANSAVQSKTASNASRTIGVRYPDATAQTLKLYAYRDIPTEYRDDSETAETVKNAEWSGVTLTRRSGTSRWWETTVTNAADYAYFIVSNNGSNQAAAQAMPATDKCYWYNPGGGDGDKIGIMDCPYTTPQLYINATAGATDYAYNEMSTSPSISKTMSLSAGTYTFKIVYNAEYYGKNSDNTISRTGATTSNAVSGMTIDQGYITLTADFAGDYIFTFNPSTNTVSVTYPTAYVVTYSKSIVGTDNSTTAAPSAAYTTGATAVTSGDLVPNGTYVTFTAAEAGSGYTWKGWYTVADPSADYSANRVATTAEYATTISAATTIYAVYAEDMHTVTVTAGTHGSITTPAGGSGSTVQAGIATNATIEAEAVYGYYFRNWTVEDGNATFTNPSSASTTVNATSDATIKANFVSHWSIAGGDSEETDEEDALGNWNLYVNGIESFVQVDEKWIGHVDIILPANTTFYFKVRDLYDGSAWYGNTGEMTYGNHTDWSMTTGSSNCRITTAGAGSYRFTWNETDHTLTVTYPTSYTVTYGKVVDNGQDIGGVTATGDDGATLESGKYVAKGTAIFTAADAANYTFVDWRTSSTYGGGTQLSTDNPFTMTGIAEDKTVYAHYAENMTTVTLAHTGYGHIEIGGETVTSTIAGVVTTRSITAVPDAGYYFAGWELSEDPDFSVSGTGEANSTITVTGGGAGETSGQTLTANFVELEKIYFRNINETTGEKLWNKDNIYVYFNVDWTDNGGNPCVSTSGGSYAQMNPISADSHVFWAYVPRSFTTGGNGKVAFSDDWMDSEAYPTGPWDKFFGKNGVYRTDYNKHLNMYVPACTKKYTSNSTNYFDNGYWMKYNNRGGQDAGYYLKEGNKDSQVDIFEATADNSTLLVAQYRFQNISNHTFWIANAAGKFYKASATVTNAACSNVSLIDDASTPAGFTVTPTSEGYYTFYIEQAGDTMKLNVVYPISAGDYQLVYTYDSGSKTIQSDVIKPDNASSTSVKKSVYIDPSKTGASYDNSFKLRKCSGLDASANPTWTTGVNISLDNFTQGKGVYEFDMSITDGTGNSSDVARVSLSNVKLYDGPYYIKTDYAPGGWVGFKQNTMELNTITFNKDKPKTFDYYYCKWIDRSGADGQMNVKCVIANDYNEQITDTLIGDDILGLDGGNPRQYLAYPANVRFSYNSYTNELKRAYINGASDWQKSFLLLSAGSEVIHTTGDAAFDGNSTTLDDQNNWIYMIDLKAQEGARVKLTANYHFNEADHVQYLIGEDGDYSSAHTEEILGGNTSGWHAIRVIYDFKTNKLISAWLADGETISGVRPINTDVLIVRSNQDDATQITLGSTANKLTEVDTVYTALRLTKAYLTDGSRTDSERRFYWLSFPYEVKISDIFGSFGAYGENWIFQRYNGKKRAQNGFWAESEPNWEYITDKSFVLNAHEGYVLTLDLSEFASDKGVWSNNVTELYEYFPSNAKLNSIEYEATKTIDIDQTDYECTIDRSTEIGGNGEPLGDAYNRTVRDSYWHLIGVPSFANTSSASGFNDASAGWTAENMPFYYAWDAVENHLTPASITAGTTSFKPMRAYLVQYSGTTITWNAVSAPQPSSIVARDKANAEDIHFAEFNLHLMRGEESVDHTYVRLTDNEDVTNGFEFGHDLCKEFQNGDNIYTMIDQLQVAGNSLSLEKEKTIVVPVGARLTADAEYTFAMPEGTNGTGVVLVDTENGTRTNLALGDYTVTLGAGTTDGRFVLEISPVANTPTGIGNVQGDNVQCTKAQKRMIDGILYIVKDGKAYDARGTRVE